MADELYIDQFTDYTTSIQVGEYLIKFPPLPNKKDIVNYGLPRDKQFFKRTTYEINNKHYYASDLIGELWKFLPENKKKEIFTKEWENLHNGKWYYIDGKTIYINEFYYFVLNYFPMEDGYHADFWDSQWFNSLLTQDSYYDPYVLAQLDIKRRRAGWSFLKNGFAASVLTKHAFSKIGLMGYNMTDSLQLNFNPIRDCMLGLPDFMLGEPYNTARAEGKLSKEKTTQDLYFKDSKNSIFTKATVEKGFDGTKLRFAIIDEFCKWENTNPLVTLEKNTLCIKAGGQKNYLRHKDTGLKLKSAGLCCLLSSVDEINDNQIGVINVMWDGCSPETATQNSCSSLDTRRYFAPAYFGYNDENGNCINKFGFSDTEKAKELINITYDNKLRVLGYDVAREYKRKHPFIIEDALTPSSDMCVFNFERLEEARRNAMELPKDDKRRPIFGQLDWVIPYREVVWRPRPDIRDFCKDAPFNISGHPEKPNFIDSSSDKIKPLNTGKYQLSLDPVDYNKKSLSVLTKGSRPAMTVKRLLDMMIDGDKFDEKGNPLNNGYGFETDRTVCTYYFRHDNIKDLWEDIAKLLVYYGCNLGHERSTRSIFDFLVRIGFSKFMLDSKGKQITKETEDDFGIKTSEQSKRNYFDCKRTYIERMGLAERHIELIDQLIKVREETMTKFDLAAADMINETYDNKINAKYKRKSQNTGESIFKNFKAY